MCYFYCYALPLEVVLWVHSHQRFGVFPILWLQVQQRRHVSRFPYHEFLVALLPWKGEWPSPPGWPHVLSVPLNGDKTKPERVSEMNSASIVPGDPPTWCRSAKSSQERGSCPTPPCFPLCWSDGLVCPWFFFYIVGWIRHCHLLWGKRKRAAKLLTSLPTRYLHWVPARTWPLGGMLCNTMKSISH